MSKFWVGLVSVLLVGCFVGGNSSLPTMLVPDTRDLSVLVFDTLAWKGLVFEVTRAEPNETLLCLYGTAYSEIIEDKDVGVLKVEDYRLAEIDSVSPDRVFFKNLACPVLKDYIGTLHSHPTATDLPNQAIGLWLVDVCSPSVFDYRTTKHDDNLAIEIIFCGSGLAYFEFRNGDYGYFYWREPADAR